MDRCSVRDYELMLLLLAAGAGPAWGVLAIAVGYPLMLSTSGVSRTIVTVLSLPLYLTFRLGTILQPNVSDPSGMVMAVGAGLGLIPMIILLGLQRWRER